MKGRRRFDANASRLVGAGCIAALLVAFAAFAPAARANLGYALDAAHPSRALPGPPKGIAVDQATQDIYVAVVSINPTIGTFGEIVRFNSDLSADGVFAPGGGYYTGVALDPVSGGFFGAQMEIKNTPAGDVGTPKLDKFTSAGVSAGSFALSYSNSFPPIVTDAAGHIYVPNASTHSVQVFSSAGALLQEITCSSCLGGSFGKPGSVALDATGNLYVADTAPDRVVKLTSSGTYISTLQSGRGAGAVAVDPGTGDILVGDMPGGDDYHVVAYTSAGVQFDDFGAGLFRDASSGGYGALSAYQIAVNATTHKVYVGEYDKFYVFERTTISPPTATIQAATNTGQLTATLNAKVNANGHAVLECEFEYTEDADVGFASATAVPCPKNPDGTASTPLSVTVSGLTPGTPYRYRLTATSNAGSVVSGAQTFETLPEAPPGVTTEPAQGVGQTGATLVGTVNPKGGAVSDCHFEFGPTAAYGIDLSCSKPGPLSTNVQVSRAVAGLTPTAAYHYRLVVTTNAGTVDGNDVEFTTASPPIEPGPSPDPVPGAAPPPPAATPVPSSPPPRCRKGFRRRQVGGKPRCVKICRKGFHRKRVRGKVRCVRSRSRARLRAYAGAAATAPK